MRGVHFTTLPARLALVPLNFMKFGVSGQLARQIFNQSVQGLQSSDISKIALSH